MTTAVQLRTLLKLLAATFNHGQTNKFCVSISTMQAHPYSTKQWCWQAMLMALVIVYIEITLCPSPEPPITNSDVFARARELLTITQAAARQNFDPMNEEYREAVGYIQEEMTIVGSAPSTGKKRKATGEVLPADEFDIDASAPVRKEPVRCVPKDVVGASRLAR